jgi:hypothetical protein
MTVKTVHFCGRNCVSKRFYTEDHLKVAIRHLRHAKPKLKIQTKKYVIKHWERLLTDTATSHKSLTKFKNLDIEVKINMLTRGIEMYRLWSLT